MRLPGLLASGFVVFAALAGCTSGTSSAPTTASEPASASPTSTASQEPSGSAAPTQPSSPGLDLPATLGVPEIAGRVIAPGPRPVLEWDAAPGAATYQLIVRDTAGEVTWAWSGATTSIAVGGGSDPAPPDTPAALISGPSTWTVVAFDDGGLAVGATADLAVAP